MAILRWGVFIRDRDGGGEWAERHRWTGNDIAALPTQWAAEYRAAETAAIHPEWDVEARQTTDPLPGTWDEAFAPLIHGKRKGS